MNQFHEDKARTPVCLRACVFAFPELATIYTLKQQVLCAVYGWSNDLWLVKLQHLISALQSHVKVSYQINSICFLAKMWNNKYAYRWKGKLICIEFGMTKNKTNILVHYNTIKCLLVLLTWHVRHKTFNYGEKIHSLQYAILKNLLYKYMFKHDMNLCISDCLFRCLSSI